jgi:Nucleotidyl transferase AbiEii toxin, Type IV TA system
MPKEIRDLGASVRARLLYDLWMLSRSFTFDDDRLARAIAATFGRRRTAIPTELPDALTPAFGADEQKQRQWNAFAQGVAVDPGRLEQVVATLSAFLMPHAATATKLIRQAKQ